MSSREYRLYRSPGLCMTADALLALRLSCRRLRALSEVSTPPLLSEPGLALGVAAVFPPPGLELAWFLWRRSVFSGLRAEHGSHSSTPASSASSEA